MRVLLWIALAIVVLAAALFGLLALLRYQRRPKFRRGPLKPLEQRLLAALVEHCEPRLAERLGRQIPLLPVHNRLHFDKSLSLELYPDTNRAELESDDVRFPNRTDFRLGTLSFTIAGEKFKAQFGATGGRLFDLVIRPNPRALSSTSDIRVTRYQAGGDAFAAASRIQQQRYDTAPVFTGLLAEWSKRYGLEDVNRPLDARAAARARSQINAVLPADYLEMMTQTDGFQVGPWHVLGLAEVQPVPLGEHNYYHLADDGAFVACVREDSRTGAVYLCAIGDDAPERKSASLRPLIEEALDQADAD